MDPVKSACRVDVSPIIKACALLARELWDTNTPDERDHWRQACVGARSCADALANELARLRELEVRYTRFAELVQEWRGLYDGRVELIQDEIGREAQAELCADDLDAALNQPVTEADLERFRKLVK